MIAALTARLRRWRRRAGPTKTMSAGRLAVTGATHTGLVRSGNQDRIDFDAAAGVAVLADGMGGHRGGDVASALAVEAVLASLAARQTGAEAAVAPPVRLARAVEQANRIVFERAAAEPSLDGMGTTLVAALFDERRLSYAHVGDSRLYLLRDGRLRCLTRDHSLIQQALDRGLFADRDEARAAGVHDNVLTRSLGTQPRVAVDIDGQALVDGDLYLICSDGLHGCVGDPEIAEVLQTPGAGLESLARSLIDRALAHGGPDNVSVVLARPSPA